MLSERLQQAQTAQRHPCPVRRIIQKLEPDEAKALEEALDSRMPLRSIYDAMRLEGIKTSKDSLQRHRKGFCGCEGSAK